MSTDRERLENDECTSARFDGVDLEEQDENTG